MARHEEKKPEVKEKKVEKKGKKVRKGRKHSRVELRKLYSLQGGALVRSRKNCPRCGPGTFLGAHKNRQYCGRCGYTEFMKTAQPAKR